MYNEYYEVIRIPDLKEREIEAFYVDESLSNYDKLIYILKKGVLCQKLSYITNIEFYLLTKDHIDRFFEFLNDEIYNLENELQLHIFFKFQELFNKDKANNNIIKNLNENHVNDLIVIIVKLIVEDEKNKRNEDLINFFNSVICCFNTKKITMNNDFITYVVNLASFGKSSYSRMYSVLFCTGFSSILNEFNPEIVERFIRSSTDLEKSVRLAISKGFYNMVNYIINNNTNKLIKLTETIKSYLSVKEDIQIRINTIIELIKLYPLLNNKDLSNVEFETLQERKHCKNFNEYIKLLYDEYLKDNLYSVLTDKNFVSKDFISNENILSLRLKLINTLIEVDRFNNHIYINLKEYDIGIEIKKYFYINLFFVSKLTIPSQIIEFVITNFNKLTLFSDLPYSPNKQRKLYQNHISKLNIKDGKLNDNQIKDVPIVKSKLTLESINNNNSNIAFHKKTNNGVNINYNNSNNFNNSTGFNFSTNWISELFKAILDIIFNKKIDEFDDVKGNNNKTILNSNELSKLFYENLEEIVPCLSEDKSIILLINIIEKKIDSKCNIEYYLENTLKLFNCLKQHLLFKLINRDSLDMCIEQLLTLILNKRNLIESIVFSDNFSLINNKCKNFIKSKSYSNNNITNVTFLPDNVNIAIDNSFNNRKISDQSLFKINSNNKVSNQNNYVTSKYNNLYANNSNLINKDLSIKNNIDSYNVGNQSLYNDKIKQEIAVNWRAISRYINLLSIIFTYEFPCSIKFKEYKLSILENKSYDLVDDLINKMIYNSNNNQIQKSICLCIVKLYSVCSNKIKDTIRDKVINLISKNKCFYIRRFFIIFCEEFIKEYTFKFFYTKLNTLFNAVIKKLKDTQIVSFVIDFIWKIYPFIENDKNLKKDVFVQIEFAFKYYKSKTVDNNNTIKAILNKINSLYYKIENINFYNFENYVLKDEEKYRKQESILFKDELFKDTNPNVSINNYVFNSSIKNNSKLLSTSNKSLSKHVNVSNINSVKNNTGNIYINKKELPPINNHNISTASTFGNSRISNNAKSLLNINFTNSLSSINSSGIYSNSNKKLTNLNYNISNDIILNKKNSNTNVAKTTSNNTSNSYKLTSNKLINSTDTTKLNKYNHPIRHASLKNNVPIINMNKRRATLLLNPVSKFKSNSNKTIIKKI